VNAFIENLHVGNQVASLLIESTLPNFIDPGPQLCQARFQFLPFLYRHFNAEFRNSADIFRDIIGRSVGKRGGGEEDEKSEREDEARHEVGYSGC